MITRPLLAGTIKNLSEIKYPVLATKKIDGIRCMVIGNNVLTRNFKQQPNNFVQTYFDKFIKPKCNGYTLDGELIIKNGSFNSVQSAIMREDGTPDFVYCLFDVISSLDEPYESRVKKFELFKDERIELVIPVLINNEQELLEYETKCLSEGYEGVMLRSLNGVYKCGRSTVKEGILLKLKRFSDSEATVVGFEEKLSNQNEKTVSEIGLSKRASKKEFLVPANTLGAIIVRDMKTNLEFGIGSGFTDELKKEIWTNQSKYLGKIVNYKHQESGAKEGGLPRFPVFRGFRSELDL